MVIVGVDDALLWAVAAFLLSFIPYLGLVLALIPPTILAFAESGLPAAAVIVVGGVVLNLIAENVLEPTLTGRALSLSTWLVFTMFFFWVWLIGPVGALLAMPITVLIVLVLDHNERTRWVAAFLSRNTPSATVADADHASVNNSFPGVAGGYSSVPSERVASDSLGLHHPVSGGGRSGSPDGWSAPPWRATGRGALEEHGHGLQPAEPQLHDASGLHAARDPLPAGPVPRPEAGQVRRLRAAAAEGKNIAIIFEKSSTRTRVSFEVAAYDQGAHVTYLGPSGTQIGHKESMKDTARVLGRIYDAIEYRGFGQEIVEELAKYAGVPVWNGLTDEFHPTQILADVLTMTEFSDKPLTQIAYCYLGDARNNMGDSLLIGGSKLGMDVRLCAPKHLWPDEDLVARCREFAARRGARITLTDDTDEGVKGVDFLYTDVWVSMGEDASVWDERVKLLKPYQVNSELVAKTGNPQVKFMHCLPAFHDRDTEVGEEMFERFGLDGMEVTERRLRVRALDRVRPGREPDAHDQGHHGRHARRLRTEPMRIVIALGGNALLKRGEPMTAGHQRANVRVAAPALARVAARARARRLARQRTAGRAARPPGRGLQGRRGLPARRPRRRDRRG